MKIAINIVIISLFLVLIMALVAIYPPTHLWISESQLFFVFSITDRLLYSVPLIIFFFVSYRCFHKGGNENIFSMPEPETKNNSDAGEKTAPTFGGILYVFAIFLVLGAIGGFLSIGISLVEFLNSHVAPGIDKYIKYISLIFDSFINFFVIYLLVIFFNKKKNFPAAFSLFLCVQSIGFLILILWESSYYIGSASVKENYHYLIRSLIAASIWIPYFLTSERVKRTFVV